MTPLTAETDGTTDATGSGRALIDRDFASESEGQYLVAVNDVAADAEGTHTVAASADDDVTHRLEGLVRPMLGRGKLGDPRRSPAVDPARTSTRICHSRFLSTDGEFARRRLAAGALSKQPAGGASRPRYVPGVHSFERSAHIPTAIRWS